MQIEPTQNKEISKSAQVLRWLGVLPGALLSAFLITFPIHWMVMLIQIFGRVGEAGITIDGKSLLAAVPPEMLERFGYTFFTPLVMVIVGAKIAPKFKLQISIALAVLWGIIFTASMAIAISEGQYSDWGWLHFAITSVLGIGGVGLGLFLTHKAQKEDMQSYEHE